MKQIIFLSLFMLFISLSFQQYIGFRYQKNNNRFKYLDSRRIRNNPRVIKMHRPNLSYNKEKKYLQKTKINNNKITNINRGPDGQYLHYGRSRINTRKNLLINSTYIK